MSPDILELLHQTVWNFPSSGVDRNYILLDVDYFGLNLFRGHIIFVFDRDLLQLLQLDDSDALRLDNVFCVPQLLEFLLLSAYLELFLLCS